MTRPMKLAAVACLATAVASSPSLGAVKKAVPKKPPAKAPAKPSATNKATAGTTQLKGSTPKFGETWTLGKTDPWNITMKSAEYTVDQVRVGDSIYCPKANEKLLVLHYTVHNPQKSEALMRFDTLHFTVVDAKDQNWEGTGAIGAEKVCDVVEMQMKPAQKKDVYTIIVVPAAGVMPKLIIKGSDDLVLRYDLRGKVKPLPAPFADPKDETGLTALASVPAQMGTYYPCGDFDVKVDEMTTSTAPSFADNELPENSHWVMVKLTAKNDSQAKALMRFDTFEPVLTDEDGAKIAKTGGMYSASREADIETNIDPGQEMKFRYIFEVANDQVIKSFTIQLNEEERAYTYDASSLK